MASIFIVEDEIHAEEMGTFPSRQNAVDLLERLKANPSAPENVPPCTSSRRCYRVYHLQEYDDSTTPWTLLSSEPAFAVGQGEVRPITPPPQRSALSRWRDRRRP
jgi:hypothetical protein